MTDYRLVPAKPTPEWVAALKEVRIGRMESVIEDVLAAAPAVQGEPVACSVCRGKGYRIAPFDIVLTCPHCQGSGKCPAPQPAEQPTISAYACTVPDDCETLHWRGQILSMNELVSVAQPAAGEEIMVNAPGDVYTLPLQPSGLSSGPRFVVHVPAQPAEHQPYPEGIREDSPYNDPAFESLCREHEIWGTPAAAQCAVFWEAGKRVAEQPPALARYQPCGCVVCTCDHETQCQGCGAKHCGTHPVGQIPGPVYQQTAQDVAELQAELERERKRRFDGNEQASREHREDMKSLVEALEAVVFYHEEVEDNDGNLMMHYSKMMRKVRETLAAHRKQQENK